jgi:hypothetical protein
MELSTDRDPEDAPYQPLIRENAPRGMTFFCDRPPDRGFPPAAAPLYPRRDAMRATSNSAGRRVRLRSGRRRASGRAASRETRNSNSAPLENSAGRPTKGWGRPEQRSGFCRRLRTLPVVYATTRPRPLANVTICSSAHKRAIARRKLSQRGPPARNSDDYLGGGNRRTKDMPNNNCYDLAGRRRFIV